MGKQNGKASVQTPILADVCYEYPKHDEDNCVLRHEYPDKNSVISILANYTGELSKRNPNYCGKYVSDRDVCVLDDGSIVAQNGDKTSSMIIKFTDSPNQKKLFESTESLNKAIDSYMSNIDDGYTRIKPVETKAGQFNMEIIPFLSFDGDTNRYKHTGYEYQIPISNKQCTMCGYNDRYDTYAMLRYREYLDGKQEITTRDMGGNYANLSDLHNNLFRSDAENVVNIVQDTIRKFRDEPEFNIDKSIIDTKHCLSDKAKEVGNQLKEVFMNQKDSEIQVGE